MVRTTKTRRTQRPGSGTFVPFVSLWFFLRAQLQDRRAGGAGDEDHDEARVSLGSDRSRRGDVTGSADAHLDGLAARDPQRGAGPPGLDAVEEDVGVLDAALDLQDDRRG